jgi:uncharacterized membrane protein YecN with MAPEG domain
MPVTALYAALLAPLYLLLSARVIAQRRAQSVEIGAGESKELLRRMRVHANFIEYVPYVLVLLALAESMKTPSLLLHAVGLALLAGRHVHAYGLSQTPHNVRMRVWGMMLTFVALGGAALLCFAGAVLNLSI